MADGLYGVKQASKTKAKEISSSTSLAFSSNLAALISGSSTRPTGGRVRPSRSKPDIFTTHNKDVKKRAAADMLDDGQQKHQTQEEIGTADSAELARSKRRMEEKVKIYNAMKKGDYRGKRDGEAGHSLVDFDRKWAESRSRGRHDDSSDSSGDDDDTANGGELIEYTDEFGRLRRGTRAEAEREERRQRIQAHAQKDAQEFAARPTAPTNIIYGDTIQHQAFNPDQVIADRMAQLAEKRDRSATPPPATHFDAAAEIRTKGTGFYNFSHDSEERKQQMEALEKERQETERVRQEREDKKQQRKQEIEERKKLIAQQRGKAMADKFLSDFDLPS